MKIGVECLEWLGASDDSVQKLVLLLAVGFGASKCVRWFSRRQNARALVRINPTVYDGKMAGLLPSWAAEIITGRQFHVR